MTMKFFSKRTRPHAGWPSLVLFPNIQSPNIQSLPAHPSRTLRRVGTTPPAQWDSVLNYAGREPTNPMAARQAGPPTQQRNESPTFLNQKKHGGSGGIRAL